MTEDARRATNLAALATVARTGADLEDAAERVVALAMDTIACDYAGITLLHGKGRLSSMATTDLIVDEADALQYELREGPCVAASLVEERAWSEDLAADPRWPRWGPKAASLGLYGLLAVRLTDGQRAIGALNLYSARLRSYSPDDLDFAHVFAVHAAATLLNKQEIDSLRTAVDARTLIGQAQGILMERFQLDASQAFSVLRRYSQVHNVKLRAVAEDLVNTGQLPVGTIALDDGRHSRL
jgi:GAF domain-containing protein